MHGKRKTQTPVRMPLYSSTILQEKLLLGGIYASCNENVEIVSHEKL